MEHALVFASIIVGVAVSDQILSLNRLLAARGAIRWDWAALAIAALVLLTNVQVWWSIAQPGAKVVSIGQFLPSLIELILLALLSAASLPDAVTDGFDLRDFYERNARYIWALYALTLAWAIATGVVATIADGSPAWSAIAWRAGDLVPLAVMIALMFLRRRLWLVIGIALLSLGPIVWLSRTLA